MIYNQSDKFFELIIIFLISHFIFISYALLHNKYQCISNTLAHNALQILNNIGKKVITKFPDIYRYVFTIYINMC